MESFIHTIGMANISPKLIFQFHYIPDQYAEEFYDRVLDIWSYLLNYVPETYKTYQRCLKCVTKNGINLQYVPKNIIDIELCIIEYKNTKLTIKYVSIEFNKLITSKDIHIPIS